MYRILLSLNYIEPRSLVFTSFVSVLLLIGTSIMPLLNSLITVVSDCC